MDNERPPPPSGLRAHPGGGRDSTSAMALAESLGRLIVFAGVYPAEHVRVTSLAGPLAEAIGRRATDEAPCSFELVEDGGLLVDEEEIPATSVATRRLRRDLDLLGVCEVDFFRTVTPEDLIEFASLLRTTTRRETGRRTFEEPALLALPPSIAARFNDFGTPEFGTQAQGEAWVGETRAPQAGVDAKTPAEAPPEEDWRRLSRLLVTDLLTASALDAELGVPGQPSDVAGVGEPGAGAGGEVAAPVGAPTAGGLAPEEGGTGPGENAAGGAAQEGAGKKGRGPGGGRAGKGRGAATGAGTGGAKDAAGGGGNGNGRGGGNGTGGSDAARALHAFAALLGAPPADRSGANGNVVGVDGTGGAAPAGPESPAGGSASVGVAGGVHGGKGRENRSTGRRRSGANTPGIAPEDGYRARGTRERIRALEEAVRRAIERAMSANGEVRNVTRIVEEARHLLPLVDPDLPLEDVLGGIREALDEHLRDAFRTESGATFDSARRPARDPVACKLELPELLKRIDAVVSFGEGAKAAVRTVDTAEQLSILLHMLEEDRRPGVVDGITRRLFSRLSRALDPDETAVMGGWIESICAPSRGHLLADRLLPLLFEHIRRAAPATVLAVLLVALQRPRATLLRVLWPHLAADLLHGCEGASDEAREQAVSLMGQVDGSALGSEIERFSALLAGRTEVSPRFLSPPRRRLSAFYEVVLALPDAPAVARLIIDGYRRSPPPNSAARALVAIHQDSSARTFLRRVLREELDGGETESLRRMATGIVAASLRSLPRESRREAWVPEAITALGVLRSSLADQIVEEILRSRRFLLLKSWPVGCRRAAQGAKAKLLAARADALAKGGAR
jgi:hypothetical protein